MRESLIKAYQKVMSKLVLRGDTVLICNSYFGVLSLHALSEGASKVIDYESDKVSFLNTNKVLENSNVDLFRGDGTSFNGKANVILINSISPALICSNIVKISNALLKKKIIARDTYIFPRQVTTFCDLINYDFKICGYNIKLPTEDGSRVNEFYSKSIECHVVKFIHSNSSHVKFSKEVEITNTGVINAIKLSSIIHITDSCLFSLSDCVIIPIAEQEVISGQIRTVTLDYYLNSSYDKLMAVIF